MQSSRMEEAHEKLSQAIELLRSDDPDLATYLMEAKVYGSHSLDYAIMGPNLPGDSITFSGYDVEFLNVEALADVILQCLDLDLGRGGEGLPES